MVRVEGYIRYPSRRGAHRTGRNDGRRRIVVAWIILMIAGLFEVAWASLLDVTKGFTRPVPTAGFLVTLAISMYS